MMVGIAIDEGRMAPGAPIREYVPSLATLPAWAPVTLQHVLDMATGIATEEHYDDPDSMYWRYAHAVGYYGRGQQRSGGAEGALGFVLANLTERSEPPGQRFNYASYLTNLLPYALEHVYGRPALELYEERLYACIGAQADCLVNVDSQGAPIVEGQVNLTLRDLVRWALLYLHRGRNLAGEQVVPPGWIDATISPDTRRRAAFERSEAAARFAQGEYHNQTWIVDPARQRFAMLGIHGQFAYFDLPEQLLIAGFGSFPEQTAPLLGACRDQLWSVITEAIARSTSAATPG
jgi:CubicO group peptidase (beta-lactamase class C family)